MAATTPNFVTVDRPWNSLDRLKASLTFLLIVDLILLLALLAGEREHRSLLQTIGRDSAPSIIASQHIKVAMADMDAQVVNQILVSPGVNQTAKMMYQARREEAAEALITAAQNITYGDEERNPIKHLQLWLGDYEALVQQALDAPNEPNAVAIYNKAARIMDDNLFSAADKLDQANLDVMEETFSSRRNYATTTRVAIVFAGLLLLALLISTQWGLAHRVRRVFNPPLLVATIVGLTITMYAGGHLYRSAEDLRVAKQDAFNSLNVLWRARALAYAAKADESRFLLAQTDSSHDSAFAANAAKVLQGDSGFLADELKNITFPGEEAAAQDAVRRWKVYMDSDLQIRLLKSLGKNDQATQLCLGKAERNFQSFDRALVTTIGINQKAFDNSVASGFNELARFDGTVCVGVGVIGMACALGLWVRIREYL